MTYLYLLFTLFLIFIIYTIIKELMFILNLFKELSNSLEEHDTTFLTNTSIDIFTKFREYHVEMFERYHGVFVILKKQKP